MEYTPALARLEAICRQAAGDGAAEIASANTIPSPRSEEKQAVQAAEELFPRTEIIQKRRVSAATGRVLVDQEARKATALDEARKKEDPRGFSHAIHCAHPFATYLAAWATIFLVIAGVVLVLSVAGLLIGLEYTGSAGLIFAAVLAVVVINYAIMLGLAACSTCRVSIFSFRRYARNRKAHHIPLLGYTVSTALSVIFCLRYRCPSCGTPQKLFGHRHRTKRNTH